MQWILPLIATEVHAADSFKFLSVIKTEIVNPIIQLLFGLAFLYFLWGVVQFVMNAAESKERDIGKRHMMYGLIGLFIMVSAFGIVNFIIASLPSSR